MDLVVRGGTAVTSGGRFTGDIGVAGGKIVQLGGTMAADEVIDARDKLVLPGGVDMHVHFSRAFVDEGDFEWADDFLSGSRAAVAGGVTTVGNITFPDRGEPLLDGLHRTQRDAEDASLADFVLHPVILHAPERPDGLAGDLAADGCVSIKLFTHMSGFAEDPGGYLGMLRAAASHGLLSMVHCEDAALGSYLTGVSAERRTEGPVEPGYCPAEAIEMAAVARVTAFAEAARAPVYLVHLASATSVDMALEARARGVTVAIETRPEYLLFTDVELAAVAGTVPVGASRARDRSDIDRLWAAIARGELDAVCTDHAPWKTVPDRVPASSMRSVRSGMSCIESSRSLLFSEGVLPGRLSLERLVAVTASGPARLFGIYPTKGTIAVGSDADLAIFDPDERWTVPAPGQSRAGWSPVAGRDLWGRTILTVRRGEIVYRLADGYFAGGGGRRIRACQ